jgi:3-hydroxybutyryl-CoA dehydrogenase
MYEELKSLDVDFYDLESHAPFEEKWSHYHDYAAVFDFSIISTENKLKFLKKINMEFDFPIISDLTCYWGDQFIKSISGIKGAISLAFPSPKKSNEYYAADEDAKEAIIEFYKLLKIKGVQVKTPGIGFTYPRVISMIINEAYFSIEDELATPEDIDTAMKFGVNYPMGPFDWAKTIGERNILMLLDTLYEVTKDQRYRASTKLRLEASE